MAIIITDSRWKRGQTPFCDSERSEESQLLSHKMILQFKNEYSERINWRCFVPQHDKRGEHLQIDLNE